MLCIHEHGFNRFYIYFFLLQLSTRFYFTSVFFTPFAAVRYTKSVIVNNKLICYIHHYGDMLFLMKLPK